MPDETSKMSGIRDVSGLPPRQYMLINSRQQAKNLPEPVVGGYLELVSSRPPLTKADSAQLVAGPDSDNQTGSDEAIVGKGVHLPYAIQWWLFAVMVPAGWVVLLRQDLKDRRKKAAAQAESAGGAVPAEPTVRQG
jgi:cytochrome oxidase assembly protein ShyY1